MRFHSENGDDDILIPLHKHHACNSEDQFKFNEDEWEEYFERAKMLFRKLLVVRR